MNRVLIACSLVLLGCQSPAPKAQTAPKASPKAAAPVVTAEAPKRAKRPAPEARPKRLISVNFQEARLDQVADLIKARCQARVLVEPGIDATVTVTLRELPWRDVLKVVSRLTDIELEQRWDLAGEVFVFKAKPKTTVQFSDASLPTALLMLARQSGQNIIIGPGVKGQVNAQLKNVRPERALRVIAETHGQAVISSDSELRLRRGR